MWMRSLVAILVAILGMWAGGCAGLIDELDEPFMTNYEILHRKCYIEDKHAEWLAQGFDDAGKKLTIEEAREFTKEMTSNQELMDEMRLWIQHDFTWTESLAWGKYFTPSIAAQWRKTGLSPEDAVKKNDEQLEAARIAEERAAEERAQQENAEQAERRKFIARLKSRGYTVEGELSNYELIKANPFALKGKFFYLKNVTGVQLLSRHRGLYRVWSNSDTQVIALLFEPEDAPGENANFYVRAIAVDPLEYQQSFTGAMAIVPVLKVIETYNADL